MNTTRNAYVQPDVPNQLIECAAIINYSAYTQDELNKKIAELDAVVHSKLQNYLRKRHPHEFVGTYRQIPAHIPQCLVDMFNKYVFPELSRLELTAYKIALTTWIKSNLKTL